MAVQPVAPGAKGVPTNPVGPDVSAPRTPAAAPAAPVTPLPSSSYEAGTGGRKGGAEAPAASEVALREEVTEFLSTVSGKFPPVEDGKAYLLRPKDDVFLVPFGDACQRAAQHG